MVYRCSNFFSSNTSWDENLNTSSKYVVFGTEHLALPHMKCARLPCEAFRDRNFRCSCSL